MSTQGRAPTYPSASVPVLVACLLLIAAGLTGAFMLGVSTIIGSTPLAVGGPISLTLACGPILVLYFVRTKAARLARRLELSVPNRAFRPGEGLPVSVVLDAGEELQIQSLSVQFHGEEQVSVPDTPNRSTVETETIVDEVRSLDIGSAAVGEETKREPKHLRGKVSRVTSFLIPESALGTYEGVRASVKYYLRVRAERTGGMDVIREAWITVLPLPRAGAAPSPPVTMTSAEGDMTLTLELVSPATSGKPVLGRVVLGTRGRRSVRALTATVVREESVGVEALRATGLPVFKAKETKKVAAIDLAIGNVRSGTYPLMLPTPWLPPSYEGALSRIEYFVTVRANVSLGPDVVARAPLLVLPPGAS